MAAVKTYDSRQEMFDAVVKGMKKQKEFGMDRGGHCTYLNETTGAMCALGLLLGKAFIKKAVIPNDCNGGDASQLLGILKKEKVEMPDWFCASNLRFLTALQTAHDNSSQSDRTVGFYDFYKAMEDVAKRYKLDTSFLRKTDWGMMDDEAVNASST